MAVLYFGGMTGGKWGTEPLRVDISLPISLISKKTIDNMGVRYEEVPSPNSFQTGGITYTPVGHLKLQWKQQGWESNLHDPEAFFVVDVSDPGIVLGNSADPYGKGMSSSSRNVAWLQ